MSGEFVLDASALAKTFVQEAESPAMLDWLKDIMQQGARLHAPNLLTYELTQVVWRNKNALRYPGDDPARAVVRETTQGIDLDHDAWSRVDPYLDEVTAYDAAYLALAVAKDATLVTYDKQLKSAAQGRVTVISPGDEPTPEPSS